MKLLKTPEDVIEALEGIEPTADLTGVGCTAVYNWIAQGKFPSRLFYKMDQELARRQFRASPSLWGQDDCG